jgi:hypothetical protein
LQLGSLRRKEQQNDGEYKQVSKNGEHHVRLSPCVLQPLQVEILMDVAVWLSMQVKHDPIYTDYTFDL